MSETTTTLYWTIRENEPADAEGYTYLCDYVDNQGTAFRATTKLGGGTKEDIEYMFGCLNRGTPKQVSPAQFNALLDDQKNIPEDQRQTWEFSIPKRVTGQEMISEGLCLWEIYLPKSVR